MSTTIPPRVTRLVRRGARVAMHGTLSALDSAVGEKGIAGTGVGPRGALAPLVALGALAGNETCADATEVIASQWASRGGERVGDLVRARLNANAAKDAKEAAPAAAAVTVDRVVEPPAAAAASSPAPDAAARVNGAAVASA